MSTIKNRLRRLETYAPDWDALTDEQLDRMAGPPDQVFSGFARTLTDDELMILRDGKPSSAELMRRFDEYSITFNAA